ncbi:hypothetical protein [uncultured Psychroserpens sp.]|uniref:hypothetical protein n=1 Tax=uncultured Psychroserpens sp. TaxID=255436 RepID=UPI002622110F|nr:hypothetical protein [uncultured Psychroserpens sp.]
MSSTKNKLSAAKTNVILAIVIMSMGTLFLIIGFTFMGILGLIVGARFFIQAKKYKKELEDN